MDGKCFSLKAEPVFLSFFLLFFLFSKKKLRRLIKYMQFRDYKSKVLKTIDDEDPLDSGMRCVVFSDSFANFLQIF